MIYYCLRTKQKKSYSDCLMLLFLLHQWAEKSSTTGHMLPCSPDLMLLSWNALRYHYVSEFFMDQNQLHMIGSAAYSSPATCRIRIKKLWSSRVFRNCFVLDSNNVCVKAQTKILLHHSILSKYRTVPRGETISLGPEERQVMTLCCCGSAE